MYIPKILVTQRYYVALRETQAFSSWATLDQAIKCIERFREHAPHEFNEIKGIVKVTSEGRQWVATTEVTEVLKPL